MPAGHLFVVPLAAAVSQPVGALVVLLVVLTASSVMLWLLIRRATSHRQLVALSNWGRETGFRYRPPGWKRPPAPLDGLKGVHARVVVCLSDARSTLAEVRTDGVPNPAAVADGAGGPSSPNGPTPPFPISAEWHVLVRRTETVWPPTGARPANAAASLLDLFSLAGFPLLGNAERFVVYGADSAAARALAASSVRALLPPNVGLLLHGRHLVLDFSARPFDGIECSRMIALADQLMGHLPAPPKS